MARPQSVPDDELLARLGGVFRDVGYDGASLTMLSRASGLERASLYHRFPGGKRQMAQEVLAGALAWFATEIVAPLRAPGPPAARLETVARRLDAFYGGGRHSCLLNMLASPRAEPGPFAPAIRTALETLVDAFTTLAREASGDERLAAERAERAVMLLQGSLVMARGMGCSRPFRAFLAGLAGDLLAPPDPGSSRSQA